MKLKFWVNITGYAGTSNIELSTSNIELKGKYNFLLGEQSRLRRNE
jgi:hypothetical protein